MYKIKIIAVVLFLFLEMNIYAQIDKTQQLTFFSAQVLDENNKPIVGASVYPSDGGKSVITNALGNFTVKVPSNSTILIQSLGFESATMVVSTISEKITLKKSIFLFGEKDLVDIGYLYIKKGDVTTAITQINPTDFNSYDNPKNVVNLLDGRTQGMLNYNNVRGLGNALVVVDGIPRYDAFSSMNATTDEIESITILRDASAITLYGSAARNGVILVKTKKGEAGKKVVNIIARMGINVPKAMPKYLGSADYMSLYNEARSNDGLMPMYGDSAIEHFRTGNRNEYPDINYYSPEYITNFSTSSRVSAEFSGGNKNVLYYANLGWNREGNFINFGKAKDMASNRLNARANVAFVINDYIKNTVGANAIFNFNKGPRTNYFDYAASKSPNLFSPFLPVELMEKDSANIKAILATTNNIIDGKYLLGGTSQIKTNAIADIYAGGYTETVNRTMEFNNRLDVDLNKLTKGLTFVANFGFDFFNQYQQSVSDGYAIYQPTWTNGRITDLTQYGTDTHTGVQNITNPSFYRKFGFYGLFNYERAFVNHNVSGSLLAAVNTIDNYINNNVNNVNTDYWPDKNSNVGLRLAYNFKHTYYIDLSGSLNNSTKLAPGHRLGFSPALSMAWTLSNESFMQGLTCLDNLKLKASASSILSDQSIGGYYYYDQPYSTGGTFYWNEKANSNNVLFSKYGSNLNLTYERRIEYNIGLESTLFDESLTLELNYYDIMIKDKIGRLSNSYMSYYTDFAPYGNNAGSDAYSGLELGINYKKKLGDFSFDIGINGLYRASKAVTRDEFWSNDYLYRAGRSTDAIFAYESMGLFQTNEEISNAPFQTFGIVKPGDIRYKDQNGDGIVNSNDQVQVGVSTPPIYVGMNITLKYKNFSLFALGQGVTGGALTQLTGSYWRMSGTDKYSVNALDRWTEATKETAILPRLTTLMATNNNQASTFWYYKSDNFNLNRLQLTYQLPKRISNSVFMNDLSFYILGTDIFTLSYRNDVRDLSTSTPNCRAFTFGLSAKF